jgi:hypothetical protein
MNGTLSLGPRLPSTSASRMGALQGERGRTESSNGRPRSPLLSSRSTRSLRGFPLARRRIFPPLIRRDKARLSGRPRSHSSQVVTRGRGEIPLAGFGFDGDFMSKVYLIEVGGQEVENERDGNEIVCNREGVTASLPRRKHFDTTIRLGWCITRWRVT